MPAPPEPFPFASFPLAIDLIHNHERLLEGLDQWVQLGLISDTQVRYLSQLYLSCPLPVAGQQPVSRPSTVSPLRDPLVAPLVGSSSQRSLGGAYLLWALGLVGCCGIHRLYVGRTWTGILWLFTFGLVGIGQLVDLFLLPGLVGSVATAAHPLPDSPQPLVPPPHPPRRPPLFQTVMAEMGIRWLLFLGLFLVIASSGILALSQWQSFSRSGQYAVLLAYTLAFAGVGLWTRRQGSLHLTTRALQTLTIVLIPINFWAMDALYLWGDPTGLFWIGVGTLALSATLLVVLHRQRQADWLTVGHALVLSVLHWGWVLPGIPVVAVYAGTLLTVAHLVYRDRRSPTLPTQIPPGLLTLAYASILLLSRAVLGSHIPLAHVGLAFGLVGWVVGWLGRFRTERPVWLGGAALLLGIGWVVAVRDPWPWQALMISGLALWLVVDDLRRGWSIRLLGTSYLLLLQTWWLLGRLLPVGMTQAWLGLWQDWIGQGFSPYALVGVHLFPCVGILLLAAARLRRQQQLPLAQWTEGVALSFGGLLTVVSLPIPEIRWIQLLLSSLLLAVVIGRRPQAPPWLWALTHSVTLLMVLAGVNVFWPALTRSEWGIVLLGLMGLEWSLCFAVPASQWRPSAWWLGIGLSGLAYGCLIGSGSGWCWLLTPIGLTVLAQRIPEDASRLRQWSMAAIFLAQGLTYSAPVPRLVGLGVGTALMLWHSRQWVIPGTARLTVGFGLALVGSLIDIWTTLTWAQGSLVVSVLILGLWVGVGRVVIPTVWWRQYPAASREWAELLSGIQVLGLTVVTFTAMVTNGVRDPYGLAAVICSGLVLGYGLWTRPRDALAYALAWTTELGFCYALVGQSSTWTESLLLLNLAVGLALQAAGEAWRQRRGSLPGTAPHGIPLFFGLVGWGISLTSLTAWSGLASGIFALIGIGVGRRQATWFPLILLSLGLVTLGAYQSLVHWLLIQPATDYQGDPWILLSALGLGFAVLYRWLPAGIGQYLRLTALLRYRLATLHWIGAAIMAWGSLLAPLSPGAKPLWVILLLLLSGYAVWQGRRHATWSIPAVIYLHLGLGLGLYWAWPAGFLSWSAPLMALLALAYDRVPWQRWGWDPAPWHTLASVIPGVWVVCTSLVITPGAGIPALLVVAAYYAVLAFWHQQLRWSYGAIALADWGIWQILVENQLRDPLWMVALISLSGLYVAQWDPDFPQYRQRRHWLRCLATGLICLTVWYESGTEFLPGLATIALGMAVGFLGVACRVRAYLYVGTVTFMLGVGRQIGLFVQQDALLLWALGLAIGMAMIWVAASFETRREQITGILRQGMAELARWE